VASRTRWFCRFVALAVFASASCSDYSLKAEGQECYAASECEQGLLCDFGVSPPVCSPTQTDASVIDAYVPVPDAPPEIDTLPPPDVSAIDASVDAAVEIDARVPDALPESDAEVPDAVPDVDAEEPDAA